jgi:hypothetical protein
MGFPTDDLLRLNLVQLKAYEQQFEELQKEGTAFLEVPLSRIRQRMKEVAEEQENPPPPSSKHSFSVLR